MHPLKGTDCMVASVEAVSKRKGEVLGKPNPNVFYSVQADQGIEATRTLVIGDKLEFIVVI